MFPLIRRGLSRRAQGDLAASSAWLPRPRRQGWSLWRSLGEYETQKGAAGLEKGNGRSCSCRQGDARADPAWARKATGREAGEINYCRRMCPDAGVWEGKCRAQLASQKEGRELIVAFTGAGISKPSGIPTYEESSLPSGQPPRDFFDANPE